MISLTEKRTDYKESYEYFEKQISKLSGNKYVILTNSGTSALHLSFLMMRRDTALMPALSFVATANAAIMANKKVDFIDVDKDTWISSSGVNCAVDLYGSKSSRCDIKDAAESFGIKNNESNITCYSFNKNKLITTYGGGAFCTNIPYFYERAKVYINIGRFRGSNIANCIGYNYRMPEINASYGVWQLKDIEKKIKTKKMIYCLYKVLLSNYIKFQEHSKESTYWLTAGTVINENINIEHMINYLFEQGIETRRVFAPLYHHKHLSNCFDEHNCPNAEYIYKHGICLPSGTDLLPKEIDQVADTIIKYIKVNG